MTSVVCSNRSKREKARKKRTKTQKTVSSFTADCLGPWHHLAVTYDYVSRAVLQCFDGEEVGREVPSLLQPDHSKGAIDEFAIYSGVLDAIEVQAMLDEGKPN